MTAARLTILFAVCFAVTVIVTLPLSAVLRAANVEARGLSFSRASGTVWNGRIEGLRWRGHDLGAAQLAAQPWALFLGRLAADVALDGGVMAGGGSIALKPGGVAIDDLTLSANVADLPVLLPLSGKVAIELAHADVGADGCRRIDGAVHTDALVNRPAGLAWSGPELSGPMTCSGGAVVIPLKGDTGAESIAVAMTLERDGSFGLRVEARTPNAAVVSILSAVGFVESGGVMTLTQRGRWI